MELYQELEDLLKGATKGEDIDLSKIEHLSLNEKGKMKDIILKVESEAKNRNINALLLL